MKCIIHIGTEKTGTTLLQNWLYANKRALGSLGVYLSDNLGGHNNRLVPTFFREELDDWARCNGIGSREEKARFFSGFLERLEREIADASAEHHTFVMTSEHFHSRLRRPEEIGRLRDFLTASFGQVTVVCYFREQVDCAVSMYSTELRNSWSRTLEDFLDRVVPEDYFFNHLSIADNWSAAFGIENCAFRIYDRDRFLDGDLRADFLGTLDPEPDRDRLSFDVVSANASLPLFQAEIYRSINKAVPYWLPGGLGTNPGNRAAKRKAAGVPEFQVGEVAADPQRAREIRDRFRECNDLFFARYFGTANQFASDAARRGRGDVDAATARTALNAAFTLGFGLGRARKMDEAQVDSLRDIALKIEAGDACDLSDALALMEIALKHRPNGGLIRKKHGAWSEQLRTGSRDDRVAR